MSAKQSRTPDDGKNTAPISDAKRAANARNAQSSTGPRTPEGKARSSMNAMKHGIYATRPIAVPRGAFAEDPDAVEALLDAISASFPASHPALAALVREIAMNSLNLHRLSHTEAAMLAGAGRVVRGDMTVTRQQADELEFANTRFLLLQWIVKRKADKAGDERAALYDWSEVDPEKIGRYLEAVFWETLHELAPDLLGPPWPADPAGWDARIEAILDACFDDDEEALRWVTTTAAEAEVGRELDELAHERAAARAVNDVQAKVAPIRSRLVRDLKRLLECYRAMEELTGTI